MNTYLPIDGVRFRVVPQPPVNTGTAYGCACGKTRSQAAPMAGTRCPHCRSPIMLVRTAIPA